MIRLYRILLGSLQILGRHFVLCYPYFLFFMVLILVMPGEEVSAMDFSGAKGLPLLTLIVSMILLALALFAALMQMIYVAAESYLKQLTNTDETEALQSPGEILFSPFRLLKEMMPGIGAYFVQFTIGGIINLVVLALITFVVFYNSSDLLGSVETTLSQLQQLAREEAPDLMGYIDGLPKAQSADLTSFSVNMSYGLLAYCLFYLITVFWPALVVSQQISAVKAYWQSIKLFFADPLTILLAGGLYLLLNLTTTILFSVNPAMVSLRAFVSVFVDVYFLIAVMLYVLMVNQKADELDATVMPDGEKLNVTG